MIVLPNSPYQAYYATHAGIKVLIHIISFVTLLCSTVLRTGIHAGRGFSSGVLYANDLDVGPKSLTPIPERKGINNCKYHQQ